MRIRFIFVAICLFIYVFIGLLCYPFYILSNRRMFNFLVRFCAVMVLKLAGIKFDVTGLENITPGEKYLIVSNHQSIVDIPVIAAALPVNMRIFAKKEIARVPLFGQVIWLYDFVFVDRRSRYNSVKSVKVMAKKMKFCSFLVFPEGTRTKTGFVGRFKSACLFPAFDNNVRVLPVALLDANKIVAPGKQEVRSGTVHLKVFEPVTPLEGESRQELADRLQKIIADYVDPTVGPKPEEEAEG